MLKILLKICSFLFLNLIFIGCSPNSLEDFHYEGQTRCRQLVRDLQNIENREQLVRAEAGLKRHFEGLVDLMIGARQYQEEHPEEISEEIISDTEASAVLENELRRIYKIEGARDIVERTQQEALVRLDAFERGRIKRRQAVLSGK